MGAFKLLAALTVLFVSPALHAEDFTGKVVGVIDGNTISVMHNGKAEKIRLNGIDCPDSGQAFGTKAKEFTSCLCLGKEVTVLVEETDRYGRMVADIVLPDGRDLNQEIVRNGFAWRYEKYAPNDTTLKALQAEAKAKKADLSADTNPIAPWVFRHPGSSTADKQPTVSQEAATATSKSAAAQSDRAAEFESLSRGMTYENVEAVFGSPGERIASSIVDSKNVAVYTWPLDEASFVRARFTDGVLEDWRVRRFPPPQPAAQQVSAESEYVDVRVVPMNSANNIENITYLVGGTLLRRKLTDGLGVYTPTAVFLLVYVMIRNDDNMPRSIKVNEFFLIDENDSIYVQTRLLLASELTLWSDGAVLNPGVQDVRVLVFDVPPTHTYYLTLPGEPRYSTVVLVALR
jgi:endonuclease YncB( thermonuclease family)